MKTPDSTLDAAQPASVFSFGAEWVRADLHLHTNADGEFTYNGDLPFYNSSYVDALEKAGILLGVITNHNKFDYEEFKALRSTAKKRGIVLLPGVELSVNDGAKGIHTLVVFSDNWISEGQDHINPFLTVAFQGKTPAEYQRENGRSSISLLDTLKKLEEYQRDFFVVFAHVEQNSGLWAEMDGGRIEDLGANEYFRRHTLGFQKVRTHDGAGKNIPCRTKVQSWLRDWYPAEVEGSDPKTIEEIGQGRTFYLKLGELSFETAKFALFDHEHRCRDTLPEKRSSVSIRSIRFDGAKLNDTVIPFSPSLNCLIGPRGNGKSAIIECCRHALGFETGRADDKYKAGLVDSLLTPGGKVVVEATDEFDRTIRVERERSGYPSVFVDGTYREVSPASVLKDILYFGQKDLSTRSETFDESFLEKLIADRISSAPQVESQYIEAVRQAAKQLLETLDAVETLGGYRKEKIELEVQIQVYADKGVDKKLQEVTLFDADRQAIVAWQSSLIALGRSISSLNTNWSETEAAYPVLHSKLVEPVTEELAQAHQQFNDAKTHSESCVTSLRIVFTKVTDALKELETTQASLKVELSELQKTLNEPQLDLERFRKKKARLEQLKGLLEGGATRGTSEITARDLLGAATRELHEFWRLQFQNREAEIRRLEAELPDEIRIRTSFKGKKELFTDFLRTIMRGSGLQAASYESLRDAFADGWELYQGRANLDQIISETASAKVKATLGDRLVEFLTFRTPDETEILYKGKPLGDYSLGQRATVILHILMHLKRHPVILIDQPEDDLDNETLYSHFIRQLLDRKEQTQFIFATHNPNIPVLGDAEQVIVCRKEEEKFDFEHGSIDAKEIQKRIVTVMEGGEDAFRRRKEIYQQWKGGI